MAWIGVWLGLSVPTVEVAQQVSFTVIFPITFVSNVFVPIATLPSWLQPFAEWNPTSTLTASLRQIWGNPNPYPAGSSLASTEPVLVTLVWVVVILASSRRSACVAIAHEPLTAGRSRRPTIVGCHAPAPALLAIALGPRAARPAAGAAAAARRVSAAGRSACTWPGLWALAFFLALRPGRRGSSSRSC